MMLTASLGSHLCLLETWHQTGAADRLMGLQSANAVSSLILILQAAVMMPANVVAGPSSSMSVACIATLLLMKPFMDLFSTLLIAF